MQETSALKRAQENPQTNRVGAVAGQGVLRHLEERNHIIPRESRLSINDLLLLDKKMLKTSRTINKRINHDEIA